MTQILDSGKDPEHILEDILGNMNLQILDKIPTAFVCSCDRKRVEKVLISLGKDELKAMANEGKPVELKCHFCNKAYEFSPDEVKSIIAAL